MMTTGLGVLGFTLLCCWSTWASVGGQSGQPANTGGGTGSCSNGTEFILAEERLYDCLLSNYKSSVRPALRPDQAVIVQCGILKLDIVDLHEKEHAMEARAWIRKSWFDRRLSWKPSDFEGITEIRLSSDQVWTPDIVLYNNEGSSYDHVYNTLVTVRYDGLITWLPHVYFKSTCILDLRKYPFDRQQCVLIFGSMAHPKTHLDIRLDVNATGQFVIKTHQWQVVSYQQFRHEAIHADLSHFPTIVYNVHLTRLHGFQQTMLLAPAVLLAIVVMFIFLIPPQANQRMHIGMGVILATLLLLLLMDSHLPLEIAHMPLIGSYILFEAIMATIAIIMSVATLNFYHRDSRRSKVPSWMKKVLLGRIGRCLGVEQDAYNSMMSDICAVDQENNSQLLRVNTSDLPEDTPLPRSPTLALEKVLDEIRRYLRICAMKDSQTTMTSHRQIVVNEWHQVSLALDRLMFCLYLIVTVIVSISLLAH